jgi:hypothetical protein
MTLDLICHLVYVIIILRLNSTKARLIIFCSALSIANIFLINILLSNFFVHLLDTVNVNNLQHKRN